METEDKDLTSALARLFAERSCKGVVSAYLFGSRVSGRAHRESDVDVAVLLDWKSHLTRRERFDERLCLAAELMSGLGINEIDTVILNDVPPTLGANIVTRGRRVFCSDQHLDHAFVRDAQLRAADLAPFLRRPRRVKLTVIEK